MALLPLVLDVHYREMNLTSFQMNRDKSGIVTNILCTRVSEIVTNPETESFLVVKLPYSIP